VKWTVERVIDFGDSRLPIDGFAQLGFHDRKGRQYNLDYDGDWFGLVSNDGEGSLAWTAGKGQPAGTSAPHIPCNISGPHYLAGTSTDTLLVVSAGQKRVYEMSPEGGIPTLLIDGGEHGIETIGNCEMDDAGNLWVNEVTGCRIWRFDRGGQPIEVLGTGEPGFQAGTVPFEEALFNWVYDLRRGPDGRIYVLDSKNFALRVIDPNQRQVSTVVGTGSSGYSGDGGPAVEATLGANTGLVYDGAWKTARHFNGPWSIALDEKGNIFIGDTQNHVIRAVDAATGRISTIAGHPLEESAPFSFHTTDPLELTLPLICSLDYHDSRLFIPDWHDHLIVLSHPWLS